MITTKLLQSSPPTIYQKITELYSEERTKDGVKKGIALVQNVIKKSGEFNLIVDLTDKNDENYSLTCHSLWARGFKEHPTVKANVLLAAVVANNSEKFRQERDQLETKTLRFFTSLSDAKCWMRVS